MNKKYSPFREALKQAVLQARGSDLRELPKVYGTSVTDLGPLMDQIADKVAEDYPIEDAACDLLEACEEALAKCPFPVGSQKAKRLLEEATAKAKGN